MTDREREADPYTDPEWRIWVTGVLRRWPMTAMLVGVVAVVAAWVGLIQLWRGFELIGLVLLAGWLMVGAVQSDRRGRR